MQRHLGIDVQLAREIHHREEQVADLLLHRIGIAQRGFDLRDFLAHLRKDRPRLAPVEAHLRRLLLHLVRMQQRGQPAGDAVERGLHRAAFFLALDLVPAPQHRRGIRAPVVAEHMRMPADELRRDLPRHRVEIVAPLLVRDLRVEDRLEQQIAEFLAEISVIPRIDGRHDLVSLLQQPRAQRCVRLLAIPGAPARPAQLGDDDDELVDPPELRIGR